MIFLKSDYSQGAHPLVMEELAKTNMEHSDGYGADEHCENASRMIKDMIGRDDCEVHMMIGGTACNLTAIASALEPYETVVALRSGHAYLHEAGGVEATGHRIVAFDGKDGKLTPDLVDRAWDEVEDEHTALPKMVYISQPTEIGTLYSKAEMEALRRKCDEKDMYLYVDGARLGVALACEENDLPIKELARLVDAFYIGGTKNGALFGEALVIFNKKINDHFRWMMRRQGVLLAKGRLIGVQMEALLRGGEDSLMLKIARKELEMAKVLRNGLRDLGIEFYCESPTNQLFINLPAPVVVELEKDFLFYRWAPEKDGIIPIRLVTGWGTEMSDIDAVLNRLKELL